MTNTFRTKMVIILWFLCLFVLFYHVWHPNLKVPFTDLDTQGLYFDSYFRPGFLQPFDFTRITTNELMDTYYSPIPTVLFNLFATLFRHWPLPFHLFSFFLHGLNSILLYHLAATLTERKLIGVLSAGIFLFYPANIQTLSWLAAVFVYLVAASFYLVSLRFFVVFLRKREPFPYGVSYFFFLLACLSKIHAVTLIPLLAFLDFFLYGSEFQDQKANRFEKFARWFDKYLPFVLTALPFIAIAVFRYPYGGIPHQWGGATLGTFSLLRFLEFITWLFFPFYVKAGRATYLVILAVLLCVALLTRGSRMARFLTLWVFLSFSVLTISNFRDISELYKKHFYLATLPFSILGSYVAFSVYDKTRRLIFPSHVP